MADYYPLISRAVAGLEKNNGENRRALYERARAALLAQLRGVTPALNESDITRERLALEESIRKVEAESARQFVEASRQARAAKVRSIEPRSTLSRPSDESGAPRRYISPASQPPQEAPSALSPDLGRLRRRRRCRMRSNRIRSSIGRCGRSRRCDSRRVALAPSRVRSRTPASG